jgi:diaminopimelate decarboxylase
LKGARSADVQAGEPGRLHVLDACGFAMSSSYNSRPRVAEVMVKGEKIASFL